MKKLISMTLAIVTTAALTAGSSSVFAANVSGVSAMSSSNSANSANQEQNFEKRKAKILEHINDRLTRLQQIQSCVQAANDFHALRACKPHWDKDHGDKDQNG